MKGIKDKIFRRYLIIYAMIVFVASVILFRGFSVATIERGKWNEISAKVNATLPIPLQPDRGDICAEDGRVLATSVPYYKLHFDALSPHDTLFNKYIDSLAFRLSSFFRDKSAKEYRNALSNARRRKNRYLALGNRKVNHLELKEIRQFPLFRSGRNRGGLITEKENHRLLPHRDLANRTIGSLNKNDQDVREGYVGLEAAFESYLKGEPGIGHRENMSGRWMTLVDKEPKHGCDVVTTLNVDYQDVTQTALRNQLVRMNADHGVAIVMEVESGDIKAIANLTRMREGVYSETMNYAINNITEPGSVMKAATMIAMLEDGFVTTQDTFDLGDKGYYTFYGKTIYESDKKGVGRITAKRIMEKSSNGITQIASNFYKDQPTRFIDRLFSMRLNEPVGIVLSGEGKPYIKHPSDKNWTGISLPWMSMGYELLLTPLQILCFYNAIANDGQRMRPRLVKEIRDKNEVVERFDTEEVGSRICSRKTLRTIQEMLVGVVTSGTARNIHTEHYSIAGKTGTSRVAVQNKGYGAGSYRASFVGYFPAERPKYSCIVVIENPRNGYYANVVSASVFREISDHLYTMAFLEKGKKIERETLALPVSMNGVRTELEFIYDELGIKTDNERSLEDAEWVVTSSKEDKYINIEPRKITDGIMPNVKGMGLKDVLYLLENMGLRVHVSGNGMVQEQSIAAGSHIKEGNVVYLNLR
ncbi:MAG: penicillin-binding protein [Marinifilaceae bacterium]